MLWKQVSRKRLSGVSGKHDKLWMLYQEFLYYVGCVFESILILNYFVCLENILNNIIYIYVYYYFLEMHHPMSCTLSLSLLVASTSENHRRRHNERLLWPTPLPGLRCERWWDRSNLVLKVGAVFYKKTIENPVCLYVFFFDSWDDCRTCSSEEGIFNICSMTLWQCIHQKTGYWRWPRGWEVFPLAA